MADEFKPGDMVRHRASGQVGVVVDADTGCVNESHHAIGVGGCWVAREGLSFRDPRPLSRKPDCVMKVHTYKVEVAFGATVDVRPFVLEPVSDGPADPSTVVAPPTPSPPPAGHGGTL